MKPRIELRPALLLFVLLAMGMTVRRSVQEDSSLAERVTVLEESVKQHQAMLEQQAQELELFRRLSTAIQTSSQQLQASVKKSKEQGFAWAGPNPDSKETLLLGLAQFSQVLEKALKEESSEE